MITVEDVEMFVVNRIKDIESKIKSEQCTMTMTEWLSAKHHIHCLEEVVEYIKDNKND